MGGGRAISYIFLPYICIMMPVRAVVVLDGTRQGRAAVSVLKSKHNNPH